MGTAGVGVIVRKQLVARSGQKNVSPYSWKFTHSLGNARFFAVGEIEGFLIHLIWY